MRVTPGRARAQPGQQKGLAESVRGGQTVEDSPVSAQGCVHLAGTPDGFRRGAELCFRRKENQRLGEETSKLHA